MNSVMNCKNAREYLLDLVEGQNGVSAEVRAHLKSCAACAEELRSLQATMAVLDEWQAPSPSPYFDSRLQARLREERRQAAQPRGVLAWLSLRWQQTAAVALAAAMAVGIGLYTQKPTLPQPHSAAVTDLQELDKNADLYANFDLLDDGVDEN
jgi:anti-sigma factor RsiW